MYADDYASSEKAYCTTRDTVSTLDLVYHNCNEEIVLAKKDTSPYMFMWYISKDGTKVIYSDKSSIYRFSLSTRKKEKIAKVSDEASYCYPLAISPDGDYCAFILGNDDSTERLCIWHNGKIKKFPYYENDNFPYDVSVYNKNGKFYIFSNRESWDSAIEVFDFSKGTRKVVAEFERTYGADFTSDDIKIFSSGTYLGTENKICGNVNSDRSYYYDADFNDGILYSDGKSAIIDYKDNVYRLDIEDGRTCDLFSFANTRYYESAVSKDASVFVYFDQKEEAFVRLSGWDDDKFEYTKKDTVKTKDSTGLVFPCMSRDFSTRDYVWKNNFCQTNLSLAGSNKYDNNTTSALVVNFDKKTYKIYKNQAVIGTDKFGNIYLGGDERDDKTYDYIDLTVVRPDGSEEKIYNGKFLKDDYKKIIRGYFSFEVITSKINNDCRYPDEDLTYDKYYVDENGKVVLFEKVTEPAE